MVSQIDMLTQLLSRPTNDPRLLEELRHNFSTVPRGQPVVLYTVVDYTRDGGYDQRCGAHLSDVLVSRRCTIHN